MDLVQSGGPWTPGPCFVLTPCRSGLRAGWVTSRKYRLKGPYVVLSFLLLLFCVSCGVIVTSVLKSKFIIISASGFRKRQKQRTNMAVQFARKLLFFGPKYRAETLQTSGETGKLRKLGFRQCKTIVMGLIPISCSSVSYCRRRYRCAKQSSFCSAVSS